MVQANAETARSSYEALASGDVDRVLETYDPEIELLPGIPSKGPWRGLLHDSGQQPHRCRCAPRFLAT
jgi:ketosteroid isomerase-like protein